MWNMLGIWSISFSSRFASAMARRRYCSYKSGSFDAKQDGDVRAVVLILPTASSSLRRRGSTQSHVTVDSILSAD